MNSQANTNSRVIAGIARIASQRVTCCTMKPYIKASNDGLTWDNTYRALVNNLGYKLSPCGVSYHPAGLVIDLTE